MTTIALCSIGFILLCLLAFWLGRRNPGLVPVWMEAITHWAEFPPNPKRKGKPLRNFQKVPKKGYICRPVIPPPISLSEWIAIEPTARTGKWLTETEIQRAMSDLYGANGAISSLDTKDCIDQHALKRLWEK